MSGPKISYGKVNAVTYYRMEKDAKLEVSISVCSKCADQIDEILEQLKECEAALYAISCCTETDKANQKDIIKEIEESIKRYSNLAADGRKLDKNSDLHRAELLNEKITHSIGPLKSQSSEIRKRVKRIERTVVLNRMDEELNTSFFFAFENASKVYSAKEYIDKINRELSTVQDMNLSASLLDKLESLKKKASEIKSGEFIHNFYQISILPFVKECKEYDDYYLAHFSEYEALKINCEALAGELGSQLDSYDFSDEAITYYRAKREELSAQAIEVRKQQYIRKCVDEAMEELGYDLIGSKESKNRKGEKFRNRLYTYGEGTAVNVTFAENGQITMELGGLDTLDRLPDYQESQQLVESMHTFCSDYDRIEERLQEKGIENKHVSLMPPEEDFAQIINMSEYAMTKEITSFNAALQTAQKAQHMHQDLPQGE